MVPVQRVWLWLLTRFPHFPALFLFFCHAQEKKQAKLLANLADEFFEVMRQHRLPQGDFPPLKRFQQVAETFKFSEFPKVDQKLMDAMDRVLSVDIPQLLQSLQDDRSQVLSQARMGAALTRIGKHGEEREPEAAGGGGGGGGGGNPFGDSMGGSGKSKQLPVP